MTSVYFGGGVANKIRTHSLPFNLRPSRPLRCCQPCLSFLAYPSAFPGPARRAATMALLYAPAIGPAFCSNQAFVMVVFILIRWILRPRGLRTSCIGAKPGANGYPRYVDTSHSAKVGKSHSCRGNKSPGPRPTCGAACAIDWRWRGGVGKAHVRFRPGEPGASVGDETGPDGAIDAIAAQSPELD